MDTEQYDLLLFLMSGGELRSHQSSLRAAQRVERHRPDGDPGAYIDQLQAVQLELERRAKDGEAPF